MHKIETRLLPISEMRLKILFLNLILTGLISVTSGHGTTTTTTTTTARAVERSCTDYAVQVCTSLELVVLAHSVTRLGDFLSSSWQIFLQKYPKYYGKFWTILHNTIFMIWLLFRQFWGKLGNFLSHRLVTLVLGSTPSREQKFLSKK